MRRLSHFALLLMLGCSAGTIGAPQDPDPRVDPKPDPDPDPDPKPDPDPDPVIAVPLALDVLSTTATCASLGAAEVVAVSPEGHLWLAESSTVTGTTFVRVLDGWDETYRGAYTLDVPSVGAVQAWTATTASMIAGGALYHVVGGERILVSLPGALDAGATFCGRPTSRAFVYSAGTLYQRVVDEWWTWTGIDGVLDPAAAILARDGECSGVDDGVWLRAGALELWQLSPAAVTRPGDFEAGHDPALRDEDVLALEDGHLFVGPGTWREYRFEHGDAVSLAAGGFYAWIRAGDALLRFDGETFLAVDAAGAALERLHPHASGGVWVEGGGRVCHLAPGPMLRVDGLRNGEQRLDEAFELRVRATEDDMSVVAELDGVEITPAGVDAGWFTFEGELLVGWQTLSVRVMDEPATRALAVKRLPRVVRSFAADVAPIYQTHCASCHAPDTNPAAPVMHDYEAWLERAAKLDERVVRRGDMPPSASRLPSWSDEEVTVINEWLSGGMRP